LISLALARTELAGVTEHALVLHRYCNWRQ